MVWLKTFSWIGLITLLLTYGEDVRINYLSGIDKFLYAPHVGQLIISIVSYGLIYIPAIIVLSYVCFKKQEVLK